MASKLVVSRTRIRKQEHKVTKMNGSFIKEMWENIPKSGKGSEGGILSSCPAQWAFIGFMVGISRRQVICISSTQAVKSPQF